MKYGRHLSNIFDPSDPYAKSLMTYSWEAMSEPRKKQIEWEHHMKWINDNIIGPPKATDHYTVEQLKDMNMVGLYAPFEE